MVRLFGGPSDRFSHQELRALFAYLDELVETEQLPGAVLLLIGEGDIILQRQFGFASLETERPTKHDTIYDLASLTKVVATTTAVLMLVERGELHLAAPLHRYLPLEGEKKKLELWHLLTHTSGLPAGQAFYSQDLTPEELETKMLETPLEAPPGKQVLYSDIGFMWLKKLVENITEEPFAHFVRTNICEPLDMFDTVFCPSGERAERAACTGYDQAEGDYLCGVVHDENARALGGVAGHAGLFAPAADLARFALYLLHPKRAKETSLPRRHTLQLMTTNQVAHLNEWRGLGWSLKSPRGSSCGDLMTDSSFGHTGFTGTSLWLDPERKMGVVLLTNAVQLGRETAAETLARLRPRVHNAAVNAFLRGR